MPLHAHVYCAVYKNEMHSLYLESKGTNHHHHLRFATCGKQKSFSKRKIEGQKNQSKKENRFSFSSFSLPPPQNGFIEFVL